MKKVKHLYIILFAVLLLFTTLAGVLFMRGGTSPVYAAGRTDFEFTDFNITYDIRSDRTMDVTIDIEVRYDAYGITGFYHDIPVNAGDRVRHISAAEVINGKESALTYDVESEYSSFITMVIGDERVKTGETHRYVLRYEYAITKPANKNAIFLNAVSFASEAPMNDVDITLNLPDGLTEATYFSGLKGSNGNGVSCTPHGNTITLKIDYLSAYNGVTFELYFKNGVLSTKTDLTPYWVVIVACGILAVLFAVKFLLFNRDKLTPVVNMTAPDDMDPLVMGKLIDNKVDKSDVTSLIYYWANKGYLKIDFIDKSGGAKEDIELVQICKKLPEGSPSYQVRMYDRLFSSGTIVKLSDLSCKFYSTVEAVTKEVNSENGKLYSGRSMAVAVLFALIGGLVMALTPVLITLATISSKLFLIAPLFMIVPAFIIFALTQAVRYNKLKLKKSKLILMYAGIALLAALISVFYTLLLPSYYVEIAPKIILCVVGFAIVMLSACIVSRTDAYVEKLNQIVGFREFILYTEKDKLELMLEENPELYYQILPYANVLGVSDIWENKFAKLTIAPPGWTTRSYADGIFDFMLFNSLMRNMNMRMTNTFVSRPASHPSSSGLSGGGSHGGHFGGFSGGGHGGGGFRGKF